MSATVSISIRFRRDNRRLDLKHLRYANYKDWGGGDFEDLMSGVDHVIAKGVADPQRLGVMGWSYGGFMT